MLAPVSEDQSKHKHDTVPGHYTTSQFNHKKEDDYFINVHIRG